MDVDAWRKDGKKADQAANFKIGKTPTVWNVDFEGLHRQVFMFSPEWDIINGRSGVTDDQLYELISKREMATSSQFAQQEMERIKQEKEEKQRQAEEEERQKQREQEIIDYSARLEGDEIVVKIVEDEEAMWKSYQLFNENRDKLIASNKYTSE